MKIGYWFKLLTLTIALSVTVLSIYWLNQGHMVKTLSSIGFSNNGQILNWCENRIQSLGIPSAQATLTEKAGRWVWQTQDTTPLNYLSVEKWFAKYCQIPVKKVNFEDFNSPMTPILEVTFISGETATFYDLGEGRVQLQNNVFSSPALQQAMKELLAFGPKLE